MGLKQLSSAHCDDLVGLPKRTLTDFVGKLSETKMREVSQALAIAPDIRPEDISDL